MQTTLKITGMHCGGCETKLQKMLPRIESVDNVAADREAETVSFEYDGSDDTLSAVKSKIGDLGYQVAE